MSLLQVLKLTSVALQRCWWASGDICTCRLGNEDRGGHSYSGDVEECREHAGDGLSPSDLLTAR